MLKRVLLVHPREPELIMLKTKLESSGLRVRIESDSLEAMHIVRVQEFDVIIVNVDLNAKVSGFELIRLMRMGNSNRKTPAMLIGNGTENENAGIEELAARLKTVFVSVNNLVSDIHKLLEKFYSNSLPLLF